MAISKSTADKLTITIVNWIAMDYRPINIKEDNGFIKVLRATIDKSYKSSARWKLKSTN